MSNESSDGKIIWNVVDDRFWTDSLKEVIEKDIKNHKQTTVKIVANKDGSARVISIEPKEYQKVLLDELDTVGKPNFGDMLNDGIGGTKSSDGNTYYKFIVQKSK